MQVGVVLEERYQLTQLLGSGGFANVWAAYDERAQADVAVKIIRRASLARHWQRSMLEVEARALRELDHPLIVRCTEVHPTDDAVLLIMERVHGRTLAEELGSRGESDRFFTVDELRDIGGRLCEAVAFAHSKGIVHRDLKAGNVMVLDAPPHLKLLDFGIAKLVDALASEATTTGRQMGTYTQIAPEVVTGGAIDHRVDVFGLGCVLFELASLRTPWVMGAEGHSRRGSHGQILRIGAEPAAEIVRRTCHAPRPSPLLYNASLPRGIGHVVATAMAIRPEDRFQSVQALEEAWLAALRGETFGVAVGQDERTPAAGAMVTSRATDPALAPVVPTASFGASDQIEVDVEISVAQARLVAEPVPAGANTDPAHLTASVTDRDAPGAAEPVLEQTSDRVQATLGKVAELALRQDTDVVRVRQKQEAAPSKVFELPVAPPVPAVIEHPPVPLAASGVERGPFGASHPKAFEMHPTWVEFSSLITKGRRTTTNKTDHPAIPVSPSAHAASTWWAAPAVAVVAGAATVGAGSHVGAAVGVSALGLIGAVTHLRHRQAKAQLATTLAIIDALRDSALFRWVNMEEDASGVTLIGRAEDTPVRGAPQRLFVPRIPFVAGQYRIGVTWTMPGISIVSGERSRLRFAEILAAMRQPAMRLEAALGWGYLKHIGRRSPSVLDVESLTCRMSMSVWREGNVDDAVNDIAMSVIGSQVIQAWMADCGAKESSLRVVH